MSGCIGVPEGYYYVDKKIMDKEEMVRYYAKHTGNGKVWRVGGEMAGMAHALLEAGLFNRKGKINKWALHMFIGRSYARNIKTVN